MPTIMLIKSNFKQELKNQLLLIKMVNDNFGRWDDNNPYSKYGHIAQLESLISLLKNSKKTGNTFPFKESTSTVYEYKNPAASNSYLQFALDEKNQYIKSVMLSDRPVK